MALSTWADAQSVPSAPTTVYATSFEVAEGYLANQSLTGVRNWTSYGSIQGNGIVRGYFAHEPQSAYIGLNPPPERPPLVGLSHSFEFYPLEEQLPQVTFSVLMSVFNSTNASQDFFDWSVFNADGQLLFSLSFPSGPGSQPISYLLNDGGQYRASGQSFSNGLPYRLTVRMDFSLNRWSASLDSVPIITGQPLTTTAAASLSLSSVDAQWAIRDPAAPGNGLMVFDQYQILAEASPPAVLPYVYGTSFEAWEGYQLNETLTGSHGWLSHGSGGNGLVTNIFPSQVQSAYVGLAGPFGSESLLRVFHPLDFTPIERRLPRVTFSVLLSIWTSSRPNQDLFEWGVFNTDGRLLFGLAFGTGQDRRGISYVLSDGDNYIPSNRSFRASTPHRLTVGMDFVQNVWSARLDSELIAIQQPIASRDVLARSLGFIAAQRTVVDPTTPSGTFMVFDDYLVVGRPALPAPQLGLTRAPGTAEVVLQVRGTSDVQYLLESSTDLQTWGPVALLASPNGVADWREPSEPGARFYRVRDLLMMR